ncbi:MAG TPA: hypothetical protein VH880_03045 [Anaeromyxobacteraceae bacterium]|jgi:hypothetical protein
MRSAILALALLAAPAARAEVAYRLLGNDADGPAARLELPALGVGLADPAARWPVDLARDRGGGRGGGRAEPALALLLGIIPGFGIGHLVAGSPRWVTWLVVDIVIAFVAWGPFWYWPARPGYFPFLNLLVLVERIFEGLSAYEAAGGHRVFRLDQPFAQGPPPPALAALPVGLRPGASW